MSGPDRRVLFVHAHPDDETITTGATMARYAAEGAHVALLTCTLGELGEILVPELELLGNDHADQLGGYRIGELDAALRALGVREREFLGGAGCWRDSGMMGTAGNTHARAFWRAADDPNRFERAVAQAVAVIRRLRPQVLVTYDERGGYGHPDHIMAHRVALTALEQAARPDAAGAGWTVAKVYATAMPRSALARSVAVAAASAAPFRGVDDLAQLPFGNADAEVSTAIDAGGWLAAKVAALTAHATQVRVADGCYALADGVGFEVQGVEYFRLIRGRAGGPLDGDGREGDLFAGIGDL